MKLLTDKSPRQQRALSESSMSDTEEVVANRSRIFSESDSPAPSKREALEKSNRSRTTSSSEEEEVAECNRSSSSWNSEKGTVQTNRSRSSSGSASSPFEKADADNRSTSCSRPNTPSSGETNNNIEEKSNSLGTEEEEPVDSIKKSSKHVIANEALDNEGLNSRSISLEQESEAQLPDGKYKKNTKSGGTKCDPKSGGKFGIDYSFYRFYPGSPKHYDSDNEEDDDADVSDTNYLAKFYDSQNVTAILGDDEYANIAAEFKTELPAVVTGFSRSRQRYIKMLNFMPMEAEVYNENTYNYTMTHDEYKDESSRQNFIRKLKNTVRWREIRNSETGEIRKESNARFVRWSDGSETFHIGSEAFDAVEQPLPPQHHQYYVRQGNYYIAQSAVTEKMSIRPKLDSKLIGSQMKSLRNGSFYKPPSGAVKLLTDFGTNPNIDRERKIREEMVKLRREEREKKRLQQKPTSNPKVKPAWHRTADDYDSDNLLINDREDAENDNAISLNAIKRNTGIRTNRNVEVDVDADAPDYDSDINDIINDAEMDYMTDNEDDLEPTTDEEVAENKAYNAVANKSKKVLDVETNTKVCPEYEPISDEELLCEETEASLEDSGSDVEMPCKKKRMTKPNRIIFADSD
ncbi:another transcription unit protein [Scaptodrosophila lebanonensis]|uniref:Another transcription unit protein n=1 Tax=Drosophila lebanonensis TaxID=7225 RepID=A0A6J2TFI0_DROLE|nr:another transcription unit protein [Scaptodrosophila lebanonensis]